MISFSYSYTLLGSSGLSGRSQYPISFLATKSGKRLLDRKPVAINFLISSRNLLDKSTPDLSYALTFRERADSICPEIEITRYPIPRRVMTTALGLPADMVAQSLKA